MLSVMDSGLRNITTEVKRLGLREETLIVIFSDNGGPNAVLHGKDGTPERGPNNFTLRDSKESIWDGRTRVVSLVSGGWLDPSLRGTSSHDFVHVSDW